MDTNDRQYSSFASFSLGDISDWTESSDIDFNESGESLSVDLVEDVLPRRVVRFGSVHVRTHKVTLGDNPSCSQGAPLSLAWNPIKSDRFRSLEEFELVFGSPKRVQRVSVEVREQWLQNNGHSLESMKAVVQEIETAKEVRAKSIAKLDRCTDQRKEISAVEFTSRSDTNHKFRNDSPNDSPLLPRRQKTPPSLRAKLRM